jgi:hypothetical protein
LHDQFFAGRSELVMTNQASLPFFCQAPPGNLLQEAVFECLQNMIVDVNQCSLFSQPTLPISSRGFPCYTIIIKSKIQGVHCSLCSQNYQYY